MVKNYGTDDSYIRVPGQPDPTLPKADASVFPLIEGKHWDYDIQPYDRQWQKLPRESGQLIVAGPIKINGIDGLILQTFVNGRQTKEDVFATIDDRVALLATGTPNHLMSLSPPVTLLKFPIVEGEAHPWTGILHFDNTSGYGSGLSRVSGHKMVKTDKSAHEAYRVDMILTTTINGERKSIPITRWMAPGIGIVSQRELEGATTEEWTLVEQAPARN